MKNKRITDTDAAALVGGTAPAGHPEFADVATALSAFRLATVESLPSPSGALQGRLDGGVHLEEGAKVVVVRPTARGKKGIAGVIAGASILAKVALGSSVALAAVATAGSVGVLPGPVQSVFDSAVAFVVPGSPNDSELVKTPAPVPSTEPTPTDVVTPVPGTTVVPDSTGPRSTPTPGQGNSATTPPVTPGTPGVPNSNSEKEKAEQAAKEKAEKEKAEKEKAEKDKAEKKDKSGDAVPLTRIDGSAVDSTTANGLPNGAGTSGTKS